MIVKIWSRLSSWTQLLAAPLIYNTIHNALNLEHSVFGVVSLVYDPIFNALMGSRWHYYSVIPGVISHLAKNNETSNPLDVIDRKIIQPECEQFIDYSSL